MSGIFDTLSNITNDEQFQTGLGLLGAGMGANGTPLVNAFNLLQGIKKNKQEMEKQKAAIEYQNSMAQQASERSKLYGEQVRQQSRQNDMMQNAQQQFGDLLKTIPGMNLSAQQPIAPVQPLGGMTSQAAPEAPQQMPAGGMAAQPSPVAPQLDLQSQPLQPVQSGKYGTPTMILDNLQKVESSGNPNAVGPALPNGERAMGAYQFLPSTIAQMKKEGIQFNPFNAQQSRDAADYYLQKLVKENGGDYSKAIAAYGGFKSKDPSSYVSKVLAGSPEQQAAQVQSMQQEQQRLQPYRQLQAAAGAFMGMTGKVGEGALEISKAIAPKTGMTPGSFTQDAYGNTSQLPDPLGVRNAAAREAQARAAESNAASRAAETASQVAERNQKVMDTQGRSYQAYQSLNQSMDTMLGSITRLRNSPGLEALTGYRSYAPAFTQGKDALNAKAELDHLKGQIFVNASQAFRRANETGGSVGQQSDWEGKQFVDSWGRLGQAQTTKEFQTALDMLANNLASSKMRMRAAYDYYHGKMRGQIPPQDFKQITAVGKQGDRRVVRFSDGSIDFLD